MRGGRAEQGGEKNKSTLRTKENFEVSKSQINTIIFSN